MVPFRRLTKASRAPPSSIVRDGDDLETRAAFASALDWWADAGVGALAEEASRDWLRPAAAPSETAPKPVVAPACATPTPATLAGLQAWLAAAPDLPGGAAIGERVAPAGDAAAGLMVVVDMPEDGDAAADQLVSGAAGRLLDRMLAAIGRDRASVYLAALAPARIAGGRIAADGAGALAETMRRHIALAAPRAVLLLGDGACSALLGEPVARARGGLRALNLDGGTVAAVATFHPRLLLESPARKAEGWRDLCLLLEELVRRC